jgi:hypothetical protein
VNRALVILALSAYSIVCGALILALVLASARFFGGAL